MRPISNRVICIPAESWDNINGPAVIEIPESFEDRLGKYYMYYANHAGKEIRLAYANHPIGPWIMHTAPAIRLEDTPCEGHIASPDVMMNITNTKLLLRFHGPYRDSQQTLPAVSIDGGKTFYFSEEMDVIPTFYFKRFLVAEYWFWAIAKDRNIGGEIWSVDRDLDNDTDPYSWQKKCNIILNMRHAHAVYQSDENKVIVYYTRIGDKPEHIRRAAFSFPEFEMVSDIEILTPEMKWEGAHEPKLVSKPGAVYGLHNQLRDPHILQSSDGIFLYYAAGGENCIGCVQLDEL